MFFLLKKLVFSFCFTTFAETSLTPGGTSPPCPHPGEWPSGVSGQAVQPVSLASLKLSMAVYGQKLDGRPSR